MPPKSRIRRNLKQHDGRDALDEDSHEAKRRKLINDDEKTSVNHAQKQVREPTFCRCALIDFLG